MNHFNRGPFEQADLPISDGVAYHLGVPWSAIARNILIVGDPERADAIADEHFESIEARGEHRGLVTCTGIARASGQRVTVTTSGMGTGSMEIVLNELAALREIDMTTGMRHESIEPLTIIRVGTSGALRQDTLLGSAIVSSAAVGLDSTGLFYDVPLTAEERAMANVARERLESCLAPGHAALGSVHPYAASASPEVVEALLASAQEVGVTARKGVTVTAPGFFACQGRDISRVPPVFPDLDRALATVPEFYNLEMEASILFRLCRGLGYRAGVICVAAANRELNAFCDDVKGAMSNVVRVAISALAKLAP